MGYKSDTHSSRYCGHHPETCTCRDWEPNQENCCTPAGQVKRYVDCVGCDRKPAQKEQKETLEEAAEKFDGENAASGVKSFIEGAKWQAEQMYSEEEVLNIIRESRYSGFAIDELDLWFEQFKKKA